MAEGKSVRQFRFTGSSDTKRTRLGSIRDRVFSRDGGKCAYCSTITEDPTIDHVLPLAHGGVNEMINLVTACQSCNARKADLPPSVFTAEEGYDIELLPIHGDPVLDNPDISEAIKAVRRQVFHAVRRGVIQTEGRASQKKLERHYRRALFSTEHGEALRRFDPMLPGQVVAFLPEIFPLSKNDRDLLLLVELAKSSTTRNLIRADLAHKSDLESHFRDLASRVTDPALHKRLHQALQRFDKAMCKYDLRFRSS